ncbi:MAG: rhodanese-like domain-containing protein [Clostridiales bacterium]|nr:rhodanese-like domain-containing protein [Clostridiales bacterium]
MRNLKIKLLSILMMLALMSSLTGSASEKTQKGYIDITADVARGLMTFEETSPGVKMLRGVIIINVSPLYTKYHIPGSRLYPLEDGMLDAALPSFDPALIYLVYGQSNSASMEGAGKLADAGFEKVFRLKDNLSAWKRAGYPVVSYNHGKPIYPAADYADATPEIAKALLDFLSDLLIIDVSSKSSQGHIPSAISYSADDGTLDAIIPTLDPAKKYLVYGHSDKESKTGAKKLIKAGFESVFRLKGNFSAWADAGYPIE